MDGRTDGWTDTHKFGGYNIIPGHFLWWGIKTHTLTGSTDAGTVHVISVEISSIVGHSTSSTCTVAVLGNP